MQQETPSTPTEAQIKHKRRISPFWLLPFIALLIAGWLVYNNWQDRGTEVTIDFQSAAGIVAGRTPIRYQGVEVGMVQSISLDDDLRNIKVTASIKNDMEDSLREGTQFWLVTPKASLAGVSGLDALVGGNYIGMMPGEGKPQSHFTALDTQPKFRMNTGELMIHLQAPDLGSLNNGSLVYYRKIPVGKVYDYNIAPDNNGVVIDVLIDRRFAKLVKNDTRFWNVSGFKGDFSLSGASVQMESLAALVNGAIAFDSPKDSQNAKPDQPFQLYPDLAHSQRGVAITLDLPSGSSLSEGRTPLIYQGLQVGTLTKMTLQPDSKVSGELTIDPSVVDLMRTGSRIEMNSPRISLNDAKLSELLTGNTLELIPGEGAPQKHFTVLPSSKSLLQQPNVLELQLTAPQSYGIDIGQPISLHGIKIGQVLTRELSADGVIFTAAIEAKYRDLVHKDSKFVVNSRLDVKLGIDGIDIQGASAQEWIDGGILILPGSKGEALNKYPLYSSVAKATDGILGNAPATTLRLTAASLPDVQTGSVVLYRKFQVGEITHIKPKANEFEVEVYIQPEYRNLLTDKSIFWAEGGAKVGLMDADIYGPSVPIMFGVRGQRPMMKDGDGNGIIIPLEKYGIKLMSIGLLVDEKDAVVWRGPMASSAIRQFITDVDWGELDYLVIDMPPGTGDIHLTIMQTVPVTGVVIVTTPQTVALADAKKAIAMFGQANIKVPIIGLVENMAYFTPEELPDNKYYIFGKDGGKELAEKYETELLGSIPLVQGIREGGDEGKPVVMGDSIMTQAFKDLAENVAQQVAIRNATIDKTTPVQLKV